MNIAILAHDAKKELMIQFCIAYCGVLSRHNIYATGTTGKMVAEATGLDITRFLSGSQGGDEQIASRIACNEIDLLLIFRDPLTAKPHEPNEATLLRLCDVLILPEGRKYPRHQGYQRRRICRSSDRPDYGPGRRYGA